MKQWIKIFLDTLEFAYIWASVIIATSTFMLAYFSTTKTVLVSINEYHEAHIEFVLFSVCLIAIVFNHTLRKKIDRHC